MTEVKNPYAYDNEGINLNSEVNISHETELRDSWNETSDLTDCGRERCGNVTFD